MSRNKINKPFIFILLLIVLIIGFLFIIQPVKKFDTYEVKSTSFKKILKREMLDSIVNKMFTGEKDFQFSLSEQDVNDIISGKPELLKKGNLDSLHCVIKDGNAVFYADLKLFSTIRTQVILKTNIHVRDNNVIVKVDKAYMGRLPVLKSFLFVILKDKMKNVNSANYEITFPIVLPEAITVNDFAITNDINFKLKVTIKSVSDFLALLKYFENAE